MTKEQLTPWIKKLVAAEKKDRNGIVAEMCREHGLKTGDGWNLLKEAGFDPKAAPGEQRQQGTGDTSSSATNNTASADAVTDANNAAPEASSGGANGKASEADGDKPPAIKSGGVVPEPLGTEEKKKPVTLRHKTDYPKYRRAGLVLSQKQETWEVTEAQLAMLKADPWVEVIEK